PRDVAAPHAAVERAVAHAPLRAEPGGAVERVGGSVGLVDHQIDAVRAVRPRPFIEETEQRPADALAAFGLAHADMRNRQHAAGAAVMAGARTEIPDDLAAAARDHVDAAGTLPQAAQHLGGRVGPRDALVGRAEKFGLAVDLLDRRDQRRAVL